MANPQFDSNTWYSLQSFGTNYYLDCNSISICGAGTDARTNFEWFQVNKPGNNTASFIRPKALDTDENGQPFCVNLNTGQPFLSLCTNDSAIWGTGYWNGRDASDGLFFYNTQQSDTQRLSLNDNGVWSLPDYTSLSSSDLNQMRWGVSSLGAINDQSYSTMPAIISSIGTAVVVTPSTSSSGSTTATSSSASSTTTSPSSPRQSSASSAASTPNASPSTSTAVVVVTPTVTASTGHSGSATSTASTATPTLQSNSAWKAGPSVRALAVLSIFVAALL